MAKLDELPITDDTVVIFYSDNGGPSYARSGLEPTNNAPLRHGKGTLYEGGIRVPPIARWPGTVAPGSTSAAQVSSVDFYPTILEVAGTVAKPKHVGDGVSLVPLLNGQDTLKVRWPVKRIPPMSIYFLPDQCLLGRYARAHRAVGRRLRPRSPVDARRCVSLCQGRDGASERRRGSSSAPTVGLSDGRGSRREPWRLASTGSGRWLGAGIRRRSVKRGYTRTPLCQHAHRLSTIREADQIVFLEDGEIKDVANHETLMANPEGAYRKSVDLQHGT